MFKAGKIKKILSSLLCLLLICSMFATAIPVASAAGATVNQHALRASDKIQVYSQWDVDAYGGFDSNWINTSGCGWFTIGHMLQWLGIIPRDCESKNSALYQDLFVASGYVRTNSNILGAMNHVKAKYSNLRVDSIGSKSRTVANLTSILNSGGVAFIHKYGHYYAAVDISSDGQYVHIVDSALAVPKNNGVAVYQYNSEKGKFESSSANASAARYNLKWYCGKGYIMQKGYSAKGTYAGGDYWVKTSEVAGWAKYAFYRLHYHSYNNGICECGEWDTSTFHVTDTYTGSEPQYVTTKNDIVLRKGPYKAVDTGKITVAKNTPIEVLQKGYNCYGTGHIWYKVKYNNAEYYVYKDNVGSPHVSGSKISITLYSPTNNKTMTLGDSCNVLGYLSSTNGLSAVELKLTSSSGSQIYYKKISKPSSRIYFVTADGDLEKGCFASIKSAGTYTLTLKVTDRYGTSQTESRTVVVQAPVAPTPSQCSAPTITYRDVDGGKQVTIKQNTSGATLYYSYYGTNGSYRSTTNSTVTFTVDRFADVSAYSAKSGMRNSTTTSRTVTVYQLASPGFQVETTGTHALVTLTADSESAIAYSFDGVSYAAYSGAPIQMQNSGTIYAYALRSGYKNSDISTQYVLLSAPDAPSVKLSATESKVAQNTELMVSWDKVTNATSYTVDVYKDGALSDTLSDITTTNATFILDDATEYYFRVTAVNKFGSSTAAASSTITAVAPLTVYFVDYDGSVLSEQKVNYGSSATTPPNPQRTGYYFKYWIQSYSCVTEDLVVEPTYEIITYTLNYLNADGERIKTEYVDYGNQATPPVSELVPPSENFTFAGWSISAESADSKCSLDFVDSNMTVQAVFTWTNADLPISVNSVDASWDGANYYTVNVALENVPDKVTTALLRVSLKTSEDKMVKTESRTVQLQPGQTEQITVSLNYTGVASIAEALVLGYDGDYLTGSTYSKAKTAEVISVSEYAYGNWSEWSTEIPDEADGREIETKTQYRYQTKSTTTSTSSTLDGWTAYGEPTLNYSAWGSESAWVSTKPTASDTLTITNTRTVTDSAAYTLYKYYHWYGYSGSTLYNSYGNGYWKNYESTTSTSAFPYYQTFDKYYPCYKYKVSGKHGSLWWLESTTKVPAVTHTEWKYKTRSQYYTYSFYKWSEWSAWQDAALTATDERNIETQVLYRYRDKDTPIYGGLPTDMEDTSGVLYEFDDVLPVDSSLDLSGKLATVMVYKGKNSDPNESQLQYVGQITIGENNAYSLSFKTKEAPTISSGDYVVAMSLEGSTGLINSLIIEAPLPSYTVRFLNGIDGSVISEVENVSEGSSVPMPSAPEVEGYRFVTWDHSGTNIRGDMNIGTVDITAHYVPDSYAVAFADHINNEILLFVSEYGTKLSDLAASISNPTAEGYSFLHWDYEEDQIVTENVVVSAVFEPVLYTVNFYDSDFELLEIQQVPYGESATLPDAPDVEGKLFLGWMNDSVWWNVQSDVDVYPLYVYADTAMMPESNVGTDYTDSNVTITLSAEDGAQIYYTLDGSIPDTLAIEYTGPFTLDESAIIRAIAVAPSKNESNILEVFFTCTEESEDSLIADKREISSYTVIAEPGAQTQIQVNMDENPGLNAYLFIIECDRAVFFPNYDEETGYLVDTGDATSNGTIFCAPYGDSGWQVLWFSETASTEAGCLFSLTLNISEEAEAGAYPIKVSYSPANTITSDSTVFDEDMIPTISGDTLLLGDINADGYITTADVIRIARYIVSDLSLNEAQLTAADVTGDGKVNAADVVRLSRYIIDLAELG